MVLVGTVLLYAVLLNMVLLYDWFVFVHQRCSTEVQLGKCSLTTMTMTMMMTVIITAILMIMTTMSMTMMSTMSMTTIMITAMMMMKSMMMHRNYGGFRGFSECVTDRQTDRPTDGHSLL